MSLTIPRDSLDLGVEQGNRRLDSCLVMNISPDGVPQFSQAPLD